MIEILLKRHESSETTQQYFIQKVRCMFMNKLVDSPVNKNIIQLLTGDEGNIWYVGPEDKMLPEAEGRGQHFVWRSNISYVAWIPSQ